MRTREKLYLCGLKREQMEKVSLGPLFHASARQGLVFGFVFTAMSACLLGCLSAPALSLLSVLLGGGAFLYLPVSLAKVSRRHPAYCAFPALWMSGIVQFICGALICSLLTSVFLLYVRPGFLDAYFREVLRQLAEAGSLGSQPSALSFPVPTVMDFVSSMFWATSFCGSMLSLVLGVVLPRTPFFRRLVNARQSKTPFNKIC